MNNTDHYHTARDYFDATTLETALDRMLDECNTAATSRWRDDIERRYEAHGLDMRMTPQTADFVRQRGGVAFREDAAVTAEQRAGAPSKPRHPRSGPGI